MSDSPRATQIENDPSEEPSDLSKAQDKRWQQVQENASLISDVLQEAREVLGDEPSPKTRSGALEGRPIRKAAQSVKAIPTFIEPEIPEASPSQIAPTVDDPQAAEVHLEEPLPLEPAPEKKAHEPEGLCSEEREALIGRISDFDAFEHAPDPLQQQRLPWPIELLAVPRRFSPRQRRALNITAITLACWVPVVWGIVMFMPAAEHASTTAAALQEPLTTESVVPSLE